ncbi:MAG: homocysteine S-methyltransferase family protein [Trueperaceae bacterium]|nr:MAG: homocysteine S-methyltransferase family protein [Trueperaceae bacterium]
MENRSYRLGSVRGEAAGGGCCGTGPEHIKALSGAMPRFEELIGL